MVTKEMIHSTLQKGTDSFIGGLGIDTLDFTSVDLQNGGNRVIVDLDYKLVMMDTIMEQL